MARGRAYSGQGRHEIAVARTTAPGSGRLSWVSSPGGCARVFSLPDFVPTARTGTRMVHKTKEVRPRCDCPIGAAALLGPRNRWLDSLRRR